MNTPIRQTFPVRVVDPDHPLTRGIDDFEIEDEPCYREFFDGDEVLLEGVYNAPSTGYARSDFGTDHDVHPQMCIHSVGEGRVLYLTQGHCTGKYDMQPLMDVAPVARRAWEYPVFYELLRRGISWGIGQ